MGPSLCLLLTRPGPDRVQTGSGDCSLHSITEPFLRYVLSIDQKRLQKGEYRVQTKYHISDIGAGMCLGPEFGLIAMSAMQSSEGLGSVFTIQPVHHRNMGRKCLN